MHLQEQVYVPLGLYVHVPFCGIPCSYCAFYKERLTPTALERYTRCLCAEIRSIDDDRAFDTIYFGGGNPGVLGPEQIGQIAENIHQKLRQSPSEWTVECSPNTVSEAKLRAWKSAGVNRLSLGVQSFDERTLGALGRKQNPSQIFQAYELIRQMGYRNVNFDLIFSAPGQTAAQLLADLTTAIFLAPEHISTYCLTYEDGTPLSQKMGNGAEEGRDRDFYEMVCDFLGSRGYEQYEISNFCQRSYASVHNKNTWRMADWIGLGPSASSQYRGKRYSQISSVGRWAAGVENHSPEWSDIVNLDKKTLAIDKIIFGLRMNEGVDIARNPCGDQLKSLFQNLQNEALLIRDGPIIRLTRRGRLLCDAIAREIFNIL
ncbi:MAG: radical SAM family heme chaperone HemW [Puniceicoccales bacterium]|jgi:oxygen-independent coproporphyrinogen-3 oxidase|nr:radical SAM family heme chaperone HemW [Puniceicoccales bacterium]